MRQHKLHTVKHRHLNPGRIRPSDACGLTLKCPIPSVEMLYNAWKTESCIMKTPDIKPVFKRFHVTALCAAWALAGCGGALDVPTDAPAAQAVPTSSASAAGQSPTGSASDTTGTLGANTTTNTPANNSPSVPVVPERTFQDLVIEAVNAARAEPRTCGNVPYPAAPPVTWQPKAAQAAQTQVDYLQQNNLFSHTGANNSNVGERLTATGYAWSVAGENLAAGYLDIATVMQGWLASAGHCANLMYADFTEIGVVVIPGNSVNTYRTYWGMVLARPR